MPPINPIAEATSDELSLASPESVSLFRQLQILSIEIETA